MAGLSAVIAARPSVLDALQLIGGLFLIYMGVASIRSGFASRRGSTVVVGTENYAEQAIAAGSINDMTGWRAYKLGVVTNLSNPKALVFLWCGFRAVYSPRYVAHLDRCGDGNPRGDVRDMVFYLCAHCARSIALDCASFRDHRYRFWSYLCGAGIHYGRGGRYRALRLVQVVDFYKRVDIGATYITELTCFAAGERVLIVACVNPIACEYGGVRWLLAPW